MKRVAYRNRLGRCWLAVAGIVFAAAAHAQSNLPEIEYGYPEQPPRVYTNSQGRADGHYPRLLQELFTRAGMSWHAAGYPASRLMSNLVDGSTHFSILVKNALLEKCCIYSKDAVWHDELRVYHVGDKAPIRSRGDLAGKSVIALAGYSYGGLISFVNDPKNRIDIQLADSHQAAFKMLDAGRADYLLDYGEPAEAAGLRNYPVANLRHSVLETVYMYLVISRHYPQAERVLSRLEAIYNDLRKEDVDHRFTKPGQATKPPLPH